VPVSGGGEEGGGRRPGFGDEPGGAVEAVHDVPLVVGRPVPLVEEGEPEGQCGVAVVAAHAGAEALREAQQEALEAGGGLDDVAAVGDVAQGGAADVHGRADGDAEELPADRLLVLLRQGHQHVALHVQLPRGAEEEDVARGHGSAGGGRFDRDTPGAR
jgi:hypothetical protein